MGATAGSLVGGVVGAVVGSFFGATAIGWTLGAMAGGYIGGAISPEKYNGPRLDNLRLQGSTYGFNYPFIWGTFRVGGNVNWKTDLTEHEGASGGKGSPSAPSPPTYSASYAAKLARRAPSAAAYRLLGIFSFGRWVYDNRSGTAIGDAPVVFYDGNDAQEADPTQEAVEGAGNVPADIGYVKAVWTDRDLSEFGNMIPQDNYLISSTGTVPLEITRVSTWDDMPAEAATSNGFEQCSASYDGEFVTLGSFLGVGAVANTAYETKGGWGQWITRRYQYDGTFEDETFTSVVTPPDTTVTSQMDAIIYKCREDTSVFFAGWGDGEGNNAGILFSQNGTVSGALSGHDAQFACRNSFVSIVMSDGVRAYYMVGDGPSSGPGQVRRCFVAGLTLGDPTASLGALAGAQYSIQSSTDGYIYVSNSTEGIWQFDENLALVKHWTGTPPYGGGAVFYCGDLACHNRAAIGGQHYIGFDQVQDDQPWPEVATLAFTPPGTSDANVSGIWNLGDGLAFVQDGLISVCETEEGRVLLSEIVADVCGLCGLSESQYDVSRIPFPVRGFAACAEGPTQGKAILESILPAYFVDIDDSDGTLKFIPRGQPSTVTIPDDDLAAHSENSEPPQKLQVVIGNEAELPRQLWIEFIDPGMSYQRNAQSWARQNTTSDIVSKVTVPVVFSAAEAKRIVDAWGATLLLEKDAYTWFTTKNSYLQYTPTDVMTVQGIDLRVTRKTVMMADGVIKWEGVRSRQGVFSQVGAGGESDGFVPPEVTEAQATELEIVDGPYPDEGREGVIRVAMAGAERRSWRGATLFKSLDGGSTYNEVLTDSTPDTIGETTTVLAPFTEGHVLDTVSRVDVLRHAGAGTLESVTFEAMCAGANEIMVGCEVMQYMTVTAVDATTDRLSNFFRGMRGTEWAIRGHAIGDRVIAMPTSASMDAVHAEYGRSVLYKAVTSGRTLATADAVEFVSQGISRAPFAPAHLGGGFVTGESEGFRMQWDRRARLHNAWLDFVDVPLDEPVEKYRVRIWEDGTFQDVAREAVIVAGTDFTAGSPRYDYTTADQTTDFGSPLTSRPAWSVSQWGVLGWGYEAFSDGSLAGLPLFTPEEPGGYVPPNPNPVDGTEVTIDWATHPRVYTGSIGPDVRFRFKTTTGSSDSTGLVRLSAAEFSSPPTPRRWALSLIAGDMVGSFAAPYSHASGSPTIDAGFTVGAHTIAGYPQVPHNTTIYLNVATEGTTATDVQMFCDLINRPA